MAQTKPIPVRLDHALIARLDSAAKRMGTNRAALIRFLVKSFGEHFENIGMGALPHDWRDVMQGLDGRSAGTLLAAEPNAGKALNLPAKKNVRYGAPKKRTRSSQ